VTTQTKLIVPAADLDAARSATGYLGEMLDPPPLAVTHFEAKPNGYLVEAYFDDAPALDEIDAALQALDKPGIGPARFEDVPDANWVSISQAALPPVEAGRFVVHGSHDAARIGRRPGAILIDAGEAFGTAHHATTQGCLEALDIAVRARPFKRVLDLGCGSGVLAIAASRLLPSAQVTASDIDPVATEVAAANARANGATRVHVVTAVGLEHGSLRARAPFDLILANILAGPLIVLAPKLRAVLLPGATVILSGLLVTQAEEVMAAYRAQGFRLTRRLDRTGWSALSLTYAPSLQRRARAHA
jgi:ribosomal protein L11 methyltransferase